MDFDTQELGPHCFGVDGRCGTAQVVNLSPSICRVDALDTLISGRRDASGHVRHLWAVYKRGPGRCAPWIMWGTQFIGTLMGQT